MSHGDKPEATLVGRHGADAAPTQGVDEAQPSGESGVTRAIAFDAPAKPGQGPFGPGTPVRITRVRTKDHLAQRVGDLGRGRLLDALVIGKTARLSVDGGPVLAVSTIKELTQLSARSVQIVTSNSTYRLELIKPPGQ
jgi:hypothetical protein